ncbi:MAG: hypothetical protein ACE366_31255 [Bradymonadia bacterium]
MLTTEMHRVIGRAMTWGSFAIALGALWGCDGDSEGDVARPTTDAAAPGESDASPPDDWAPPEGCNPLAPEHHCLLPWPSDHWRQVTETGGEIRISDEATLVTDDGTLGDFDRRRAIDGFSPNGPIITVWPRAVDPEAIVFHDDDIGRTLGGDSPTLIFEADTGAPVPHFAELDPRATAEGLGPESQALLMRPMVPLKSQTRYIVAIRGLTDVEGELMPVGEGFKRLADPEANVPALGAEPQRFAEEIIAPLQSAGVEVEALQLAWDFTVRDMDRVRHDMLTGVELALGAIAVDPPEVMITEVTTPEPDDRHSETIAFQIEGMITAPLILEGNGGPGSLLRRGADGEVVVEGVVQVPFTALVPFSVVERIEGGGEPVPLMQFGHGFFGGRDEIARNFVHEFVADAEMVAIAVDWWGMSLPDGARVLAGLARDPTGAFDFVERVHQGMVNQIALSKARIALSEEDAFTVTVGDAQRPILDPEHIYFYGISQGHILGGTLAALAPDYERVALSVGGGPFTFMMFRAWPFIAFLQLIEGGFPDPLDQQIFAAQSQWIFDLIDPMTYAPLVLDTPPSWAPAERRVLLHAGLWDTHVTPLATEQHARTLGVPQIMPSTRVTYGLEGVMPPHEGSGFMLFDFKLEPPFPGYTAIPPTEGGPVHGDVRQLPSSQLQVRRFFEAGVIEGVCEGPCDPE